MIELKQSTLLTVEVSWTVNDSPSTVTTLPLYIRSKTAIWKLKKWQLQIISTPEETSWIRKHIQFPATCGTDVISLYQDCEECLCDVINSHTVQLQLMAPLYSGHFYTTTMMFHPNPTSIYTLYPYWKLPHDQWPPLCNGWWHNILTNSKADLSRGLRATSLLHWCFTKLNMAQSTTLTDNFFKNWSDICGVYQVRSF